MTQRPLDNLLTQVFDTLSNQLAGGRRVSPSDLLPGADNPTEGAIPDEFLPEVETFDWFDPTVWADAAPGDIPPFDLTAITPATGPGREGNGLDWFRGGEAPNNYVNRNNPLYKARKDFIVAVAPKLEDMFGVSAEGSAGYYRAPAAGDAKPGGRSPNSDHYSAGALDIYGTPEQLTNLRNWLVEQPWVSFLRYQSESHEKHLHLSVDVGWIAKNYFNTTKRSAALPQPNAAPQPESSHEPSDEVRRPPPPNRGVPE